MQGTLQLGVKSKKMQLIYPQQKDACGAEQKQAPDSQVITEVIEHRVCITKRSASLANQVALLVFTIKVHCLRHQ